MLFRLHYYQFENETSILHLHYDNFVLSYLWYDHFIEIKTQLLQLRISGNIRVAKFLRIS